LIESRGTEVLVGLGKVGEVLQPVEEQEQEDESNADVYYLKDE